MFFLTAGATSTETARGTFWRGACATAPCGDQMPPRVTATTPAATSAAATPNTNVRFFIPFVEPGTQFPRPGSLSASAPILGRFLLVCTKELLSYPARRRILAGALTIVKTP